SSPARMRRRKSAKSGVSVMTGLLAFCGHLIDSELYSRAALWEKKTRVANLAGGWTPADRLMATGGSPGAANSRRRAARGSENGFACRFGGHLAALQPALPAWKKVGSLSQSASECP